MGGEMVHGLAETCPRTVGSGPAPRVDFSSKTTPRGYGPRAHWGVLEAAARRDRRRIRGARNGTSPDRSRSAMLGAPRHVRSAVVRWRSCAMRSHCRSHHRSHHGGATSGNTGDTDKVTVPAPGGGHADASRDARSAGSAIYRTRRTRSGCARRQTSAVDYPADAHASKRRAAAGPRHACTLSSIQGTSMMQLGNAHDASAKRIAHHAATRAACVVPGHSLYRCRQCGTLFLVAAPRGTCNVWRHT